MSTYYKKLSGVIAIVCLLLISCVSFCYGEDLSSKANSRVRVYAPRVSKPPVIDGALGDDCWRNAGEVFSFVRSNVGEVRLATNQTQAWLLHDKENLYVAMRCHDDNMPRLSAHATADKRDGPLWREDCVEVFLDTTRSREKYHQLIMNALGSVYDAGPDEDIAWDSRVRVKTTKGSKWWTVEMAIPFRSLGRETPEMGEVWGVNLTRHRNNTRRELSSLAYIGFGGFHSPGRFGDLIFTSERTPGLNVQSIGKLGGGTDSVHCILTNPSDKTINATLQASLTPGKEAQGVSFALQPEAREVVKLRYNHWGTEMWLNLSARSEGQLIYRVLYPLRPIEIARVKSSSLIKLNLDKRVLGRSKGKVTVLDINGKTVYTKSIDKPVPPMIPLVLPGKTSLGTCRFIVDLMNEDNTKVAHYEYSSSYEVQRDAAKPAPKPTDSESQRGYYLFTRSEPGDIYPVTVPSRKETFNTLELKASLGERCGANFAINAIRELSDVSVQVSDFRNMATNAPLKSGMEVYSLNAWPQRLSWNTKHYHVIPELLERKPSLSVEANRSQQYYLRYCVPSDAQPGDYQAIATIKVGPNKGETFPIKLRVLPFKLAETPGIIWGLYPDSSRWKRYKPAKRRAIMKAIRQQGINSLIMYPFKHGSVKYVNGKVSVNLAQFNSLMKYYKEFKYSEPFVLSLQSMDYRVQKWLPNAVDKEGKYTPVGKDAYRQTLECIRREAKRNKWPRFVVHTEDEPHPGNKRAIRTLKLVHEAGFQTFTTWPESDWANKYLSPYVDYRCYCNIGYHSLPTRQQTDKLRRSTARHGGVFWYYGSGCYGLQDGNIVNNRFMSGCFFWRTGATGEWAWTFNRPKDNPFDDMDGNGHGEAKDACTVYDARNDTDPFTPTLQWEGIREGINDYRYYYTLDKLIRANRESGDSDRMWKATNAERRFKAMLESVQWRHADRGDYPGGNVSNADLNRHRDTVIELILGLMETTASASKE